MFAPSNGAPGCLSVTLPVIFPVMPAQDALLKANHRTTVKRALYFLLISLTLDWVCSWFTSWEMDQLFQSPESMDALTRMMDR